MRRNIKNPVFLQILKKIYNNGDHIIIKRYHHPGVIASKICGVSSLLVARQILAKSWMI
jgi:hypothetical protein